MKLRKRIQLMFLSLSIVSFIVLTLFFFIMGNEGKDISAQDSELADSLQFKDQKIYFYYDTNNNQQEDNEESICEQCVSKQILVEIVTDIGKELVVREIESGGTLNLKSTRVSALWAYLPSEKLVIPTYTFTSLMEEGEFNIPVIATNYELVGENSNIGNIDYQNLNNYNYEINFEFTNIIPALDNYLDSDLPVWYVYYPNINITDKYYISSGLIEASNDTTVTSSTVWHFVEEYSTIGNLDQYKLLIPKP